jgi:hypothetical protein
MAISGNGIPRPFENSELGNSLTNAMIKDHLLISEKPFRPNNKGLDFLEGFWFEGFILKKVAEGMKALNIDPSSAMLCTNVNIKWRSKIVVGNETTSKSGTNEIDIAFIANDSLYLISCTTASESEVEKRRQAVENFSDRLGGRFAKAMIACTLPNNDSFAKIFSRKSQRMLITNFTHWLKPANVLDEWFNMAK